jgi:hypothetical protein
MPGRVLNFLEFSDKYSNASSEPTSIDDLTGAAANFEEGFDDETYDQPQIGPNRPVSGSYEATPSKPGEEGAPAFSSQNSTDMNAPEEEEDDEDDETEEEETEEGEEVEEGNPEAGANPKKKVDEGFTLVKGFSQFINETYEGYGNNPLQDENGEGEEIAAQTADAVDELSKTEKRILAQYIESNPEDFKDMVKDEIEEVESGSNPRERDYEALGMDKDEFETRKIIHKIITYVVAGSALGIVPAAMFVSGGIAAALGVTALAGVIFKDAAWAGGKEGHHYSAQNQAQREWDEERGAGSNPWDEDYGDEDECPMCGEAPLSNEYGYSCGCNM